MSQNFSFTNREAVGGPLVQISNHNAIVPYVLTFAAFSAWTLRFVFHRRAALRDLAACVILSLLLHWRAYLRLFFRLWPAVSCAGPWLLFLLSVSTGWASYKISQSFSSQTTARRDKETEPQFPPLILPCRTTHTRFFPSKHSFSYSYLYVGIPIGWTGQAGTILSADCLGGRFRGDNRSTWLSVEAEDYLERGFHKEGLRGKLLDYLRSQGIRPEQYPHAFLVTAPRFLGYSFNPVSFWFLYTETKSFGAMILEVNNTFDERRMYYMERPVYRFDASDTHFTHEWKKDFHVSPFNSRDGYYTLKTTDLFDGTNQEGTRIDCNIVLKDAEQKAKLVARVFSTENSLEARSMTRWQTLLFVSRWWWVGFMTNPRILREARSLWFKKLQLYYRPEVMETSIGRQETAEEEQLEVSFRLLLECLTKRSSTEVVLNYIPAAGPSRGATEVIGPAKSGTSSDTSSAVVIRVLTPAFYSQFARYLKYWEAFDKLCIHTADPERYGIISDPKALSKLLAESEHQPKQHVGLSLRWRTLRYLRGRTSANNCVASLSQLDWLVLTEASRSESTSYCRSSTRLLLSDTVAFGFSPLVRFYGVLMWATLTYAFVQNFDKLLSFSLIGWKPDGFLTFCGVMGLHLWALVCRVI